jgi:hypothetical protein
MRERFKRWLDSEEPTATEAAALLSGMEERLARAPARRRMWAAAMGLLALAAVVLVAVGVRLRTARQASEVTVYVALSERPDDALMISIREVSSP